MDTCRRATVFFASLLMLLGLWAFPAAGQATITVNATADNTTGGDGFCTLREAITNANSNSDTTGGDCIAGIGLDTIVFAIPGSGPHTIQPTDALPDITDPVTIDGAMQQGATCGNDIPSRVLKIVLDGSLGTGSGLVLLEGSDGSTIRGLVINNWPDHGVLVAGTDDHVIACNFSGTDVTGTVDRGNGGSGVQVANGAKNNTIGGTAPGAGNLLSGNDNIGVYLVDSGTAGNVVQGNYIGTDKSGTAALGNTWGGAVSEFGPSNNTIGGTAPGAGNVISGNDFVGVNITGGSSNTLVQGNFIGTDPTGTVAVGNAWYGVNLDGVVSGNVIGGTTVVARNVISGNDQFGVRIATATATNNIVQGNYIGTDVTGTTDLGNTWSGVHIADGASDNTIGGTTTGARNVISGNEGNGVDIVGAGTTGNVVEGNYIGTDATGTADLGNTGGGVGFEFGPTNNTIGGTAPGAGNVISGNDFIGINITTDSHNNLVEGNFIGTDASGAFALGNAWYGVNLDFDVSGNVIGGTAAGARNVISANGRDGVRIATGTATNNLVQGNFIGTDVSGKGTLGNAWSGVGVEEGASNNTIGGTAAGAGNTIAFNQHNGITVTNEATVDNAFLGNTLFLNAGSGIDLEDDGATANDPGDGDSGCNNVQNFPDITDAIMDGSGNLGVTYAVDTRPAHAAYPMTVEFFRADVYRKEGHLLLGRDTYTAADFAGGAKTALLGSVPGLKAGQYLVATATDADGNTSEFSFPAGEVIGSEVSTPPQTDVPFSFIQVIHNVPERGPIDVYLDDRKLFDDVSYQAAAPFTPLPWGNHKIDVVAGSDSDNARPIWTDAVTFQPRGNYALIAMGRASNVEVLVLDHLHLEAAVPDMVEYLLIHGAPELGDVDLRLLDPLDNATVLALLVNNFAFGDYGGYRRLAPGGYTIQVTNAGNSVTYGIYRLQLDALGGRSVILNLSGPGTTAAEGVTIMGVAPSGDTFFADVITCCAAATGETAAAQEAFALAQNYPNPFNPSTTLTFDLSAKSAVSLVVYDVLGRRVRVLVEGVLEAGRHAATVEMGDLPSGLYVARLVTPQGTLTRKMVMKK